MDLIQRKTFDKTVESFIQKAASEGVALAWDRYEGQVPECGFCETGQSCRDCLQGPCISHPFKNEINKLGVCGKDSDILAAHSLLRVVIKGTMAFLDQVNDFACTSTAANTDTLKLGLASLFGSLDSRVLGGIPSSITGAWAAAGIMPEGVAKDLIKASQKLEGGITPLEETILWAFKCALLGCAASMLKSEFKKAEFGEVKPVDITTNIGAIDPNIPNLVLYGEFSPVIKAKIAKAGKNAGIGVYGIAGDPLLDGNVPVLTNHASQEVPIMTGAIDLILAGDQFVNPSLLSLAGRYNVPVVSTQTLNKCCSSSSGGVDCVDSLIQKVKDSKQIRGAFTREVPSAKNTAAMGYSGANLNMKAIADGLSSRNIKGIVIFAGNDNVKLSQDTELTIMTQIFLDSGILCLSEGDASIALSKYGYLTKGSDISCADSLKKINDVLGVPAVIDITSYGMTEFLCALSSACGKAVKDIPVAAVFAEASRNVDVVKAVSAVAFGVNTYFWPALPVGGGQKVVEALKSYCSKLFGASLHVIGRSMAARVKAANIVTALTGEKGPDVSGNPWYGKTGAS